ncbi:hypothetical protein ABIA35_005145 [Catenulispora sp. MAP12-49]|uniref:hypothetical protein n=1 Tax=Catenulispora sp. MAP12-49 TaxID=3156302 RepID=UPI0035114E84
MLKLRVSPDGLVRAGFLLAEQSQPFTAAFATSGPYDLSLHVWLPDLAGPRAHGGRV